MNKKLFAYPRAIPEHIREVPMYKTMKYRTHSRREKDFAKDFDKRIKMYSGLFSIESEPDDLGDIVLFRDEDCTLEIYRASDSIWWTDRKLAYREEIPEDLKLPSEEDAMNIATDYLNEYRFANRYARFDSVSYTEVASSTSENEEPELLRTGITVNYAFQLDGIPVMGPGAKIQVSLVEDGKMCELLHFWREPDKVKEMQLIHPMEALEKVTEDPSFMRLSPDDAVVDLHRIRFGYYAITPTDFQRYLIPVYAVDGTAKTEALERYDFTRYVVAIDLSAEEIKEAGIIADPSSCTMF